MVGLARSFGRGPRSLADIARAEQLPLAYTEQLAAPLRRAGLVQATRGARGGYMLARDPASITALDVMRAVDGEVTPVDCTATAYVAGSCERESFCSSRPLWVKVKRSIDQVLAAATLESLAADPALVNSMNSFPQENGPAKSAISRDALAHEVTNV